MTVISLSKPAAVGVARPGHVSATLPPVSQLTSSEGTEFWASWSPKGDTVLFSGTHAGTSAIYVMAPDGSGQRLLASAPVMDRHPRWLSNDAVIFDSRRTGNDDLFEIKVDGSGLRQLTTDVADDGAGVPSSDGRHIAFLSKRGGRWELFAMNRSGGLQRLLATDGISPAWIPSSPRLLFGGTSTQDLFEADVITGQVKPFLVSTDVERNPRPSPDGRWVLFTRGRDSTSTLWLKDRLTDDLRQLASPRGPLEWTTWCRDNARVVFSAGRSGEEDLFVADIRSGRVEQLTTTPHREISPTCDATGRVIFSAGHGDALDLFSLTLPEQRR